MQTLASLEGAETTNTSSESPKNGSRHVLEFEKPLAKLEQQIRELEGLQAAKQVDYSKELRQLRTNYTSLLRKTYDSLSAWETVQVARHPQRPLFKDYVEMICREFRELHGDRQFGDDKALLCGFARLGGHKVCMKRSDWEAQAADSRRQRDFGPPAGIAGQH